MPSALILSISPSASSTLESDLASVGVHILGAASCGNLVREAVRLAPEVIVCHETAPEARLFEACALLAAAAPRPVLLFTLDPDAGKMDQALASGIHAYVVNGYDPARLRGLIHLARARFGHEQRLKAALDDITHRFEERKLVDRAKGILMRARQVSEDEAFRVLRTASMHSNQRVGQVSRHVIDAARYAEAVNRAGQLRMLSQRLVKLYALQALGAEPQPDALLRSSCERIEANIAALGKSLSPATFGDLLDAVQAPWSQLKPALAVPADALRLNLIDELAERVLATADQLTSNLENAGLVQSLHVINLSGRQRMLSQRWAKQVLMGVLLRGEAARAAQTEADQAGDAIDRAMADLHAIPLISHDIGQLLDTARLAWQELSRARPRAGRPDGLRAIGEGSESLLQLFEQLTAQYERSMQVLMG